MQKSYRAAGCFLFAAGLVLSCKPASAGLFNSKQPVPQWGLDAWKTKTPEYAKDAAAVILYDEYVETIDANGRATERHRKVVRILKPQGRDNLCGVAYDVDQKITFFRAWTIAADEKQYQAQDTDFVEVGDTNDRIMLSTQKVRVANPPAIDVGAVLVCESEKLEPTYSHEKSWRFQDDIPAVFAALELNLPSGQNFVANWHRHDAVKPIQTTPGQVRWELKDVPALRLRDIPSSPDWDALAARMSLLWGDAAVSEKDKQWQAIGQWFTNLEADRPAPSPEITAKVQALTTGAPDLYTKLVRITESIQKEIRYFVVMRGIGGLQANHASDIFRNRYGDCKDKTTLLISMLQVAGIHAAYMAVDTHRGVVDADSPSQFGNHMITAIELPSNVNDTRLQAVVKGNNGKRYLVFDPTNERTPVGNLPSYLQGGYGILCDGAASQILPIPVLGPEMNETDREGNFTLSPEGSIHGTVNTSRSGAGGASLRNNLKVSDEKERRENLERSLAYDLPGVVLNSYKYDQPEELAKPAGVHYELTASHYAHLAGPLLLVRPRVIGTDVMPFDDKPRTLPIDLEATGRWRDSYDIKLPDGFVVDELPDPVDVDFDFASYHSKISSKGNVLHYEREYVVKQVEIPAEKAAAFRKLEGAIIMDEKGTAVLKKAAERASRE